YTTLFRSVLAKLSGIISLYRELFWIVKNGIRFSGMPAFGKVESDEHIWNLVNYLRTLRLSGS
ncbi:MAG: cytochrome c, partial [Verrucomicrobia bacterium]|nr:cytochrome c [Verrucomicrobiota bacterium]